MNIDYKFILKHYLIVTLFIVTIYVFFIILYIIIGSSKIIITSTIDHIMVITYSILALIIPSIIYIFISIYQLIKYKKIYTILCSVLFIVVNFFSFFCVGLGILHKCSNNSWHKRELYQQLSETEYFSLRPSRDELFCPDIYFFKPDSDSCGFSYIDEDWFKGSKVVVSRECDF